jgi:hypothetical protein
MEQELQYAAWSTCETLLCFGPTGRISVLDSTNGVSFGFVLDDKYEHDTLEGIKFNLPCTSVPMRFRSSNVSFEARWSASASRQCFACPVLTVVERSRLQTGEIHTRSLR